MPLKAHKPTPISTEQLETQLNDSFGQLVDHRIRVPWASGNSSHLVTREVEGHTVRFNYVGTGEPLSDPLTAPDGEWEMMHQDGRIDWSPLLSRYGLPYQQWRLSGNGGQFLQIAVAATAADRAMNPSHDRDHRIYRQDD